MLQIKASHLIDHLNDYNDRLFGEEIFKSDFVGIFRHLKSLLVNNGLIFLVVLIWSFGLSFEVLRHSLKLVAIQSEKFNKSHFEFMTLISLLRAIELFEFFSVIEHDVTDVLKADCLWFVFLFGPPVVKTESVSCFHVEIHQRNQQNKDFLYWVCFAVQFDQTWKQKSLVVFWFKFVLLNYPLILKYQVKLRHRVFMNLLSQRAIAVSIDLLE